MKERPVAYYNEIDPYAAQWLRNLIAAGHIAPGDVDERSIEDVKQDAQTCLLYTSPSPRDRTRSRMPSSA